jgi:hypothetical protein
MNDRAPWHRAPLHSAPLHRTPFRLATRLVATCLTAACTAELPAATPEGLQAAREAIAAVPKARCDACHGAGEAPAWATGPESITRVRLERHSGGGYRVPSATKTLAFEESLSARRLVELSGEAPTDGLGTFGARAPADERAALAPDHWAALAAAVANSGLFRFEGEAVSTTGTHGETAFVFVERRDRGTCILGSMRWPDDAEHETIARVPRAIEEIEAGLAWSGEEH